MPVTNTMCFTNAMPTTKYHEHYQQFSHYQYHGHYQREKMSNNLNREEKTYTFSEKKGIKKSKIK